MKVPQQKHPSVFLQARHQGKCHVGLPLCHNTLSRKGTYWNGFVPCLQRDGVQGLFLPPACPKCCTCCSWSDWGGTSCIPPHGPAGKVSSTTGAKSCSPSHNLHTASSRDSLVHKSLQEFWTCSGHICQCRGQLFCILVVSPWCQGKELLFLGTSARSSWQGLRDLSGVM